MSALTSLLVRDQVVSVRKIEEAIQRQVISGGELEAVLLDMGAVPENVMSAYRAALYGLLPATRDEIMKVPRETIRLVPREVAVQYRLIPLSAEGRTLVVAISQPLSAEVDEQLGFLLGHDLVYRVVTEVRVAASLAHHYNVEMTPQFLRLVEKLRHHEAGKVPYVAPARDAKVDRAALIPDKGASIDWSGDEDAGPYTDQVLKLPERSAESEPPEAEEPELTTHADVEPEPVVRAMPVVGVAPVVVGSHTEPKPTPLERPRTAPAVTEPSPPPESALPRLRGPLTAKVAVESLNKAANRDAILEVFFTFARQFFDYAALFVVHDDRAEGHEAFGSGADSNAIHGMAIPLDVPGIFSGVRSDAKAVVADLSTSDIDAILVRDLGRAERQPAAVVPITIRKRVVMLFYGDRDGESFGIRDIPELTAIVPRVGDAFERLILRKKQEGYAKPPEADRSDLKAAASRAVSDPPAAPPKREKQSGKYSATIRPGDMSSPPARGPREGPLGVLGVPRSAPPPPMPAGAIESAGDGQRQHKKTDPQAPISKAAREYRAARDEAADVQDDVDDEPELTVEESYDVDVSDDVSEDDAESLENIRRDTIPDQLRRPVNPKAPPVAKSDYSYTAGREETVSRAGQRKRRSKRPLRDPRRRSTRPDPRREEDGSSLTHDVIQIPARDDSGNPVEVGESAPPTRPARRPSVTPVDGNFPSVIVDMGDSVEALVDELVTCGPDDESNIVASLQHLGEAALPSLVQRFPGPLWFDRRRPHRRLPRGRDISAIARALFAFRERAVPYFSSLLKSNDPDVRFYAVLLSSEFISLDLLARLSDRVFDDDSGVQILVLDVLRHYLKYEKEIEEMLKAIRVEAKVERKKEPGRRRVAVRALGELRDQKSLTTLIELVDAQDPELAAAAHRALVLLTRQDFGDSSRRWSQWASKNAERHRIEWLIDGLLHADEAIRSAACDELKLLTQEYYGYHPASPRRDREIAQRKYRRWWDAEGKGRFAAR